MASVGAAIVWVVELDVIVYISYNASSTIDQLVFVFVPHVLAFSPVAMSSKPIFEYVLAIIYLVNSVHSSSEAVVLKSLQLSVVAVVERLLHSSSEAVVFKLLQLSVDAVVERLLHPSVEASVGSVTHNISPDVVCMV